MTPQETRNLMLRDREHWQIPFMDFVDHFRRTKGQTQLPLLPPADEKFDALIASSIEYLCNEINCSPPDWIFDIPACREPWFVAGIENLKAITIVESPVWFRTRKIFVLENFLKRV